MIREDRCVILLIVSFCSSPFSYVLQAMIREDYRCIVTRILDKTYARTLRMAGPLQGQQIEDLECCHIFAESINTDIDESEKKVRTNFILRGMSY